MDKDKEKEEEIEKKEEPPKKKNMMMMIVILFNAVIILGVGGYFGLNMYTREKEKKVENIESPAQAIKEKAAIIFPIKSFIVNLRDKAGTGKKYLKITMEIEVKAQEDQMMVQANATRVRDTILLLLASQSVNEINTMEGKLELKQAVLARINRILGKKVVQRIYFTDFVIQ